jgi:hypothetical protein
MADLDVEIAAYRAQLFELETQAYGQWVVFHGAERQGVFRTFEEAAQEAVRKFGRGPYLIRQVGAPPVSLPVCAVQRKSDERSTMRL